MVSCSLAKAGCEAQLSSGGLSVRYGVQWDDRSELHVSRDKYIAVGDEAYAPLEILEGLCGLEKQNGSLVRRFDQL
jgi:hypothetical protein